MLPCPVPSNEEEVEEEGGSEERELGQRQEEVKERWGREEGKAKVMLFSEHTKYVYLKSKKILYSHIIQP